MRFSTVITNKKALIAINMYDGADVFEIDFKSGGHE
jgi:hypothetical protein